MGGTAQPVALIIGNRDALSYQGYCSYDGVSSWIWGFGTSSTKYKSISVGAKIRLRRINGLTELYVNDELYFSSAQTINGNCTFGHYTNNGRRQQLKDIKIRRL